MSNEIDEISKFILFKVVIDFLANDIETCFNTCDTNFSNVTNNNLFEGNILRIKALALE